jgi:hypothetical protein
VKQFGRIDVVVNNAGYSLPGSFEEMICGRLLRIFSVLGRAKPEVPKKHVRGVRGPPTISRSVGRCRKPQAAAAKCSRTAQC